MLHDKDYDDLDIESFALALGVDAGELPDECLSLIKSFDFRYKRLSGKERDNIIIGILEKINSPKLSVSGQHRKQDWQNGWSENLEEFSKRGYDLSALVPKYMNNSYYLRLGNDYAKVEDINFELNFSTVFRHWLFRSYFKDAAAVYEFGAGTSYHLALLAKIFPSKRLFALDWAKSSADIAELLKVKHNLNIDFHHFDFYSPDRALNILPNSAVFTMGALEQVGSEYKEYVQFILDKKPALCLNVECLDELYDQHQLPDYLALLYHKKRDYLSGYLGYLNKLEAEGKIKISKAKRLFFGSLYHEVYSFVVWYPL